MKIKASKIMSKQLQKSFDNYTITYKTMYPCDYKVLVDHDDYIHENDFNLNTYKFSVIVVEYPSYFYAMPKYLTTNDLLRCFKKSDKTYDDFINQIKNQIEV